MSNNLLLSMMSAFSYLDVSNGDDFNDLKGLCIPIGSTYTFTNYSNGDTLFTVYYDANTTPDAYCWLKDGSVPSTAYSSLDVMFI